MKDLGAFVALDDLLTLISLPASWISTKEKKYIKAGTLASVIAQARHTLYANLFDQFIIDRF